MNDKPSVVVHPQPQGIMFTTEMLENLIKGLQQSTIEAVRELKKRDPEEEEKYQANKKRERELRVSRVKEALLDERSRREVQFACSHIKYAEGVMKQEHAFRGQVNNDNCCRPTCIRCNKLFPKFKVSEEQMKSGMALGNVKNLTAEVLWTAHMKSFPDCPECLAGNCAVRDIREKKQRHLDPLPTVLPDGKVSAAALTA